jgi:structural maintenance of chromosome 2
VHDAQTAVAQQKALLKACNQDINQKLSEQQKLQKDVNDAQLQVQEMDHKVAKHNKDSHDAAKQVGLLFILDQISKSFCGFFP